MACLTSAMACVTWMPRGHASEQLKVVRQRHTPSLSLRISRRMSPASSRESKMNRWAFTIAAGPKYWPSVQNTGQDDVHAAHRMHLVVSSKRSRSSADCRRSLVGSWPLLMRNGMTSRKDWKKGSMSTIRSFSTGRPLMGSTVMGLDVSRSFSSVLQARRLRPLMRMASEPQTPWAQERRNDRLPSTSHLTLCSASSTRSVPYMVSLKSSQRASSVTSGSYRRTRRVMSNVGISPPPPTPAGSSILEAGSASSADILVLPHHRLVARKDNRLGGKPDTGDCLFRGTVGRCVVFFVRHGVLHEFFVVAVRGVLAEVAAAGFLTVQGSNRHDPCQFQQEPELNGLQQVKVEPLALVLDADPRVPLLEGLNVFEDLVERVCRAEHLHVGVHGVLQFLADRGDFLGAVRVAGHVQQPDGEVFRVLRQLREVGSLGVFGGGNARALAEHVDVQQRVGTQAVGTVHGNASPITGGEQARNHGVVVP